MLIFAARSQYVKGLVKHEAKDLASIVPHASDKAINLLKSILIYRPRLRVTAANALEHPYLLEYRDEVLANSKRSSICVSPFDWGSEKESSLDETGWLEKVVDLIDAYNIDEPRDEVTYV